MKATQMFKLVAEPTFTHTVKVTVPIDGGFAEQTFKATFLVIPVDEMTDTSSLEGQQDLLRRVVRSLDEIVDDAGEPIPYSERLRDQMIASPYARVGLYDTYLAGVFKARRGN